MAMNAADGEVCNNMETNDISIPEASETEQLMSPDSTLPVFDTNDEISALYTSVPEIANHFTILNKIGEGAFSTVYRAQLKHYPEVSEMFALKHIIPTSHPSRIENELKCLLKIGGQDNVMGVKLCMRHRDHVIVVMPLFAHDRFNDILPLMDVGEMRDYMRNLLISLRRVHEFNVIHRDIKPSNFLYNRENKEYALVDFGLATGNILSTPMEDVKAGGGEGAQKKTPVGGAGNKDRQETAKVSSHRYDRGGKTHRTPLSPSKKANVNSAMFQKAGPSCQKNPAQRRSLPPLISDGLCSCFGKPMICHLCVARSNQFAPRAGTAGFRPPEVLLKSSQQDTAVDVWAAGVIFLSILSCRYPFFRAQDDQGYFAQIVSLLGTEPCVKAAASYGKLLIMSEQIPAVDLRSACLKLRSSQMSSRSQSSEVKASWAAVTDNPFDLLAKMLDPNPKTRITSLDALQHPFFYEDVPKS